MEIRAVKVTLELGAVKGNAHGTPRPFPSVVGHCVLFCSMTQESEPVRTGSMGLIVKKEKHVQLVLNRVLSFELKFPTTPLALRCLKASSLLSACADGKHISCICKT